MLTEAIQSTTDKLNQLKSAEAQVQAQFERGEISQEQYRGFRRELQQTEQQLNGYQQALIDMDAEQGRVEQGTRNLETLFQATGTSVENYANVIGQRLVRAIQDGTATSRDLEYAFQRIGRDAIGANGDIERLRTTLQSLDNGNSIQNIRNDLQQLQTEAQETAESVEGIGVELENVAGALVAGGGIAGAVSQALDMSSLDTKIDITFEVPEESKQSVKEAVLGIEAYGLDAEEALEGVRRQWALNKDASDEVNTSISKGAAAIAKNFAGVDFVELIQETNEVAAALKISNEEALALTDALLKAGFPPEQLDTLSEYGQQMKDIGFNTAEIQAIFEAGVNTKTWNIDNLNDGVKEARLQMSTFGYEIPKALQPLLEQAGMSEKKFQEWGKAVAAGGEEGSKAMSEVATWLDSIDNKELKNELATKVFGTKWEDQGQNMIAVFQGVSEASDQTNDNLNGLYETMGKTNADPMVELQHAINNVKIAAEPTLQVIADIISKISNWIAENPKLAATIATIVSAIGILVGIFMALAPIITSIATMATALGVSIGAVSVPILAVIAGIAALIAIGVLLYQNWDEISAKAVEVWGAITEWFSQTWETIKQGFSVTWEALKIYLSTTWESIKETAANVWNGIKEFFLTWWDEILAAFGGPIGILVYLIASNWDTIKNTTSEVWNGIKTFFKETWDGIKNTVTTIVNTVTSFISEKWNNIKTNTSTIFNSVKTTISNIWGEIKTWLSTTVENIKTTVTEKFEALRGAIQEKLFAVKTKVIEIWNEISTWLFTKAEGIKNTVKEKFEGLKTGVQEKLLAVKSKIEEIWGQAKSFLEDIDLMDIGKNIIQGLIDGITGKASDVYTKIAEIANNIKDKFTGLFDINSPSRVFKGYGINLNEGLIQGIQATSAKLNKAVENVYGSISNSAQRMMNGSGSGSSVTSTIDQSKKMYNTINISTNTDSTRSTERMLRRLAYEF
ncbi:replication protein [Cytobacillus firmus]|uniref:replication protein n=1 Tax=Cytobacillus firmus TaxID=1399 RepID=UPI00369811B9